MGQARRERKDQGWSDEGRTEEGVCVCVCVRERETHTHGGWGQGRRGEAGRHTENTRV